MRSEPILLAFNRGLMDRKALARIDLKRTALSAEISKNWLPRSMGSMMLRPGTGYLGSVRGDNPAVFLPFIFATDDTALVELTNNAIRVWVDDQVVSRPVVATEITNGAFDTDLTGWTDSDESGSTSDWATGGYLSLTGTGKNAAIRDQEVTVAVGDQGVEHALNITITQGLVTLTVGATIGAADYIAATVLRPGQHSIAFTPTDDFFVRLSSTEKYASLVAGVTIAASGDLVLTSPWAEADLPNVRGEQSGDVIFVCDGAHQQRRIERQGPRSWSIVLYEADTGPYRSQNTTPITLTAAATSGSTTLTASTPLFNPSHVGALFRLENLGQVVSSTLTGEDQWTESIRVVGVNASRNFYATITGLSAGTVTVQQSIGGEGDWVTKRSYTTNQDDTEITDSLDNQIVYYRIGIKAGSYVSGSPFVQLSYGGGSSQGVCRVTGYTSPTIVSVDVLNDFGKTTATTTWWEGSWSSYRGWPSAVAFHDGRLWWAGNDKIYGSVSDAFSTFDDTVEGDSGPISRNLGSGPVDTINWLLSLNQLTLGTLGAEKGAKASSLDEPLTPTAFGIRTVSTQGSARVPAVRVDTSGLYVQRNGRRVYELALTENGYSYSSNDMTAIAPNIGNPGIARLAVQRQPDTRVHCVRTDGTVALLVFDKTENVNCWVEIEMDGEVEEVVVLPGADEDSVYYVVKRTLAGGDRVEDKRYLEKWSTEAEGLGAAITKLTDSHLYLDGPLTTVTGLYHLEGKVVAVWGNTKDLGEYTVTDGAIALTEEATNITVGLPYTALYKSGRIVLETRAGSVALAGAKHITHLGLLLADTHAQGLRYGQDFDHLDDLPLREGYYDVPEGTVHTDYEEQPLEVNGTWESDARLCLEAASPRPCTILACVVDTSGHAK